jgi:two-component system, NtrC family, response regulator AtoC
VFPIHIPPLRERRDDVLPLAEFFLKSLSARMRKSAPILGPEARELLRSYDWPENARELANALERALIVTQTGTLEINDLLLKQESIITKPG